MTILHEPGSPTRGPVPKLKNDRFSTSAAFIKEPFWTSPKPGPVPKSKNDDFVQVRSLKMSRFDPPEPDPYQSAKMTILYKADLLK